VDTDGTALSYEIEKWDETATSYVWVKVPQIDINSNTDYIYMYYGNTGASDVQNVNGVWNSDYTAVWHFKMLRALRLQTRQRTVTMVLRLVQLLFPENLVMREISMVIQIT